MNNFYKFKESSLHITVRKRRIIPKHPTFSKNSLKTLSNNRVEEGGISVALDFSVLDHDGLFVESLGDHFGLSLHRIKGDLFVCCRSEFHAATLLLGDHLAILGAVLIGVGLRARRRHSQQCAVFRKLGGELAEVDTQFLLQRILFALVFVDKRIRIFNRNIYNLLGKYSPIYKSCPSSISAMAR